MRRLSVLFCMIILLISISSCRVAADHILEERFRTEDLLPEYDMQLEYAVSKGSLCQYNGVYYYKPMMDAIYYYDRMSGTSGKLCAKADCTHNTRDCNAYLSSATGIQIYDGTLYFMENSVSLYSMDLSGNNRLPVMTLRNLQGTNPKFVIHRGYVYTSVSNDQIQAGEQKTRFTLCQQVLGNSDPAEPIIDETFDGMAVEAWILRGNHLYAALDAVQSTGNLNKLYDYNIQTGELSCLWNEKSDYGVLDLRVKDSDTGLEMIQKKLDGQIRKIEFDFKTNDIKENLTYPKEAAITFVNFAGNGAIGYRSGKGILPYQIFNEKGKVNAEGTFPGPSGSSIYTIMTGCGSDEEGVYIAMHNTDVGEERLLHISYESSGVDTLISCSRD